MSGRDFRRAARKIRALKDDIQDEVDDAVESNLGRTKQLARQYIQSQDAIWKSNLVSMFVQTSSSEGSGVQRHKLYNTAPYAEYVEMGTGGQFGQSGLDVPDDIGPFEAPDGVPFDAILDWVETKPVLPRSDISWPRGLAAAIRESIEETGTKPQPFMRPAWYGQKPILKRDVRNAVSRAIRRV